MAAGFIICELGFAWYLASQEKEPRSRTVLVDVELDGELEPIQIDLSIPQDPARSPPRPATPAPSWLPEPPEGLELPAVFPPVLGRFFPLILRSEQVQILQVLDLSQQRVHWQSPPIPRSAVAFSSRDITAHAGERYLITVPIGGDCGLRTALLVLSADSGQWQPPLQLWGIRSDGREPLLPPGINPEMIQGELLTGATALGEVWVLELRTLRLLYADPGIQIDQDPAEVEALLGPLR